ncbi:unnamed protein product [Blepharisma stoltei]|uniref:Etoposide-induced protein 2.4 n=1 Tax=Blepharisma stoltei TaxID=1481888 RepID=A0AAU9J527_9CILI|nr:unnamed protein product [Blepharisma stoltei]
MWAKEIFLGTKDSLNYFQAAKILMRSKDIHKPLILSICWTGFVFLGSLLCFSLILDPLLQIYPRIERLFTIFYYILWLFPLYFICFILNTFCYADIALSAFQQIHGQPKATALSISRRIAYEAHRGLIIGIYVMEVTFISLLPFSEILDLFLLSWLYSFYCFEYRWALEGKTINREISIIEHNSFYYFGFGLPFALITFWFPGLMGNGLWLLIFPVFMVTALISKPPSEKHTVRIPLFKFAHRVSSTLEVFLLKK